MAARREFFVTTKYLLNIETPALRRECQLQDTLRKAYNLDGFMQLCFDLDVEYEDLPGQTLSAKTREIVQFMGRRNQLDVLEAKIRRERPGHSF
ncbi:MAG: hypothetical protein R6X34_03410 [Chloroflexota bacterium]